MQEQEKEQFQYGEIWPIEKIKPYPLNAKIHDKAQVAKIAESIKKFGWTTAIVVDKNGEIIAGHGRRLAAIQLGYTSAPVVQRLDLTDEEVKALRLADNRVAIAPIDGEKLQAELAMIEIDLAGIFDKKELDFLQADLSVIDDSKFITDVETAVREQNVETAQKISAADNKDVQVAKVLGFRTIKTKDEKYVAAFLAQIEERTGLQGSEAFVAYCKEFG